MTEDEFVRRAVKAYRSHHGIPVGWWGRWNDLTDGTCNVRRVGTMLWRLTKNGRLVSQHASKASAVQKARRL